MLVMVESYFFISVSVRGHVSILNLGKHRVFFLQIVLHFRPDEDSWRVTEFVSKKMDSSILSNFLVLLKIWLLI